jgi:hypothetical protein
MKHTSFHCRTFIACLFIATPLFGQSVARIHPDETMHQTEIRVTNSPFAPQRMIGTARTISTSLTYRNAGQYLSANGGSAWIGADTSSLLPGDVWSSVIPAVSANGMIFLVGILPTGGIGFSRSSDWGTTWSARQTLASGSTDAPSVCIDDSPGSPWGNALYGTWTDLSQTNPVLRMVRSPDGGTSWTSATTLTASTIGHYPQGALCVTGIGGEVYVLWANARLASPYANDFIGVAKSTDGGATWSVRDSSYACEGIRGTLAAKGGIRVDDFPRVAIDKTDGPKRGWIYVVTAEKNLSPAGSDPDIVLHRSTDGGNTWSAGVRVNQDPLNNGKMQYAPYVAIDDGGGLNVIYHDDRLTSADSAGIFLSRSTDGGDSWSDSFVSGHFFKPSALPGIAYTERTGLVTVGEEVLAFWVDDVSGTKQVWSAQIDRPTGVQRESELHPDAANLRQNYPNPFNPVTTFLYSLPRQGRIILSIHNILGQTLAVLVDAEQCPGSHRAVWNAGTISSGVYIAKLIVEDASTGTVSHVSRKITLLR